MQENLHNFATNKMPTKSMANPEKKSTEKINGKSLDVGLYKVRYAYQRRSNVPNMEGNESREFCRRMMQFTNQGIEWRLDDIKAMSDKKVNGAFAEKGQSSYSLFDWAGGCYCRHGWMRRIYFRKTNPNGTFMPNKGLDNETRVGNNPFIVQKGSESIAQYDKPNHGKVNPPFKKN